MTSAPPAGFERIVIARGFAAGFGPVFLRRDRDQISLGFRVDARHVNIGGACHGGALATLADLQLAALQRSQALEPGHGPTISLSLDYLAPAKLHDWVESAVTLVKRTRRLAFTQALLRVGDNPVARSTALYSLPDAPKSSIGALASAGAPSTRLAERPPTPPVGYQRVDVGPGFGARFGDVFVCPREGRATLGFRVAESHVNIYGACHGGALATFADSQIAALRWLGAIPNGHCPTISLSIDYLAPARLADWVESDVTLVKATRRFIFTQAILATDSGPIARSTAIYATPPDAA